MLKSCACFFLTCFLGLLYKKKRLWPCKIYLNAFHVKQNKTQQTGSLPWCWRTWRTVICVVSSWGFRTRYQSVQRENSLWSSFVESSFLSLPCSLECNLWAPSKLLICQVCSSGLALWSCYILLAWLSCTGEGSRSCNVSQAVRALLMQNEVLSPFITLNSYILYFPF